jgi:RNA polymerase sigma-70 factor (ECF subfamily)
VSTGWDLVSRAQAGDERAFGELLLRYRPQVRRFVASKVRDREAVEDLTSETFLRAWRSLNTARDQGRDVSSWLVRIAHNLVIDHARAVARSGFVSVGDPTELPDPGVAGPEAFVPEQRNRRGASQRLGGYLQELPVRERECLRLRFVGELSAAQVGDELGCTAVAAKTLQYRAVRRLAAVLEADGFTGSDEFAAASPDPRQRKKSQYLREVA